MKQTDFSSFAMFFFTMVVSASLIIFVVLIFRAAINYDRKQRPKVSSKDGMTSVYVPDGYFMMGSPEEYGSSFERPLHRVFLNPFYIDQTEVTNAMFAKFISETNYVTDAELANYSLSLYDGIHYKVVVGATWGHPQGPTTDITGLDNHPVVNVSWNDAKAYCEWAGRRLPTEAEWEKATRGKDELKYPWGNNAPNAKLLNSADNGYAVLYLIPTDFNGDFENAFPKGSFSLYSLSQQLSNWNDGFITTSPVDNYGLGKSPYGAYDMLGNVREWVADYYDINYDAIRKKVQNPTGATSGSARVVRGSSFADAAASSYATARAGFPESSTFDFVGFRCARDVKFID